MPSAGRTPLGPFLYAHAFLPFARGSGLHNRDYRSLYSEGVSGTRLSLPVAAALLLAACGTHHPPSVPLHIDNVERAAIQQRASRSRPLQPLAAPDTPSTVAARPAPQRTPQPPTKPAQPHPAAGCTGRMTVAAAHACWDHLLTAYPWPTATAFRILYCESTGNPNAVNGRYRGLFQVEGGPLDPAANVAAAYGYWVRRGWEPWACA